MKGSVNFALLYTRCFTAIFRFRYHAQLSKDVIVFFEQTIRQTSRCNWQNYKQNSGVTRLGYDMVWSIPSLFPRISPIMHSKFQRCLATSLVRMWLPISKHIFPQEPSVASRNLSKVIHFGLLWMGIYLWITGAGALFFWVYCQYIFQDGLSNMTDSGMTSVQVSILRNLNCVLIRSKYLVVWKYFFRRCNKYFFWRCKNISFARVVPFGGVKIFLQSVWKNISFVDKYMCGKVPQLMTPTSAPAQEYTRHPTQVWSFHPYFCN